MVIAHVPNGTQHLDRDCLLFLDLIYRKQARIDFYRADADLSERNYSRLSAVAIRQLIDSHDVPKVIEKLESLGIIEIDHWYKVGERPKGYRLTQKYAERKTLRIPVEGKGARKLKRALSYEREPRNAIQRKLDAWQDGIEIDLDRAEELIKKGVEEESLAQQFRHLAELIHDKVVFFSCDDFAQRIHTNVSNFPKLLHPCLTYKGQKLINVDIRCSQPYFLATILLTKQKYLQTLHNTNTKPTNPHTNHIDVEFVRRACDGTLYDFMPSPDREVNKKAVFFVMFCKIHERLSWQERLFREAFPLTFASCVRIKQQRKGDDDGYKDLAQKLQKTESDLMINGVCAEIIKARPEAPLFTIHDSIMTTEPHVDFVHDTIVRLASMSGLTPKVRKGDD